MSSWAVGLETTYHRCDNGKTHWYAVDLPHVIEYRRGLLPEPEREFYISGDAFVKDWIIKVRNDVLDAPILVTAGGLFHYFEEHKVIALLRMIGQFGNMEVVFDTVNKRGMTMMKKKYMKQVGHADAQMFFYVDSAEELAAKIGGNVKVIAEEPYYRYIPKNGLKLSTKVSMTVSDQFKMVKMISMVKNTNKMALPQRVAMLHGNISPYQLSYVTNSGEGEGLLFYGTTIIPLKDKFDKS